MTDNSRLFENYVLTDFSEMCKINMNFIVRSLG